MLEEEVSLGRQKSKKANDSSGLRVTVTEVGNERCAQKPGTKEKRYQSPIRRERHKLPAVSMQ